jgi:hypothetical protein
LLVLELLAGWELWRRLAVRRLRGRKVGAARLACA